MRLFDEVIVYSPGDIVLATECQFATLRRLDEELGWIDRIEVESDSMMQRVARLGDQHEKHVLAQLKGQFGEVGSAQAIDGVFTVAKPDASESALVQAAADTVTALRSGVDVVFQAAFFDGRFNGFADFLLKRPDGNGGSEYVVADTKLATRAKTAALIQIAAYADQLRRLDIPVGRNGELILGDGVISKHDIERILPVYRQRRREAEELLDAHQVSAAPVAWGDPKVRACGRCDLCELEVAAHRDVLLVAGMRITQRAKLTEAGIHTIDELAASTVAGAEIGLPRLDGLRAQARLQVLQTPAKLPTGEAVEGAAQRIRELAPHVQTVPADDEILTYEVLDTGPIAALPMPSPGDVFFDFEGDPMWQDTATGSWGLEYLFGVTEAPSSPGSPPKFKAFWAHDRAEEKAALRDFLDYVAVRRRRWPDLHIYHYAAYEKTALLRLAATHATGEDEVDDLLRNEVLRDLYPVVKGAIRVGQPSYSLKKIEPYYMTEDRGDGVTNAADSVVEYAEYCIARDRGEAALAAEKLAGIETYNRYDCESTLGLYDWLRSLLPSEHAIGRADQEQPPAEGPVSSATGGSATGSWVAASEAVDPLDETIARLYGFANESGKDGRTPIQTAAALIAAAVGFWEREEKPYWWGHFERLNEPVSLWSQTRDVIEIEEVAVVRDWYREGRQRVHRRDLELTGTIQPGCDLLKSQRFQLLYENPPEGMKAEGIQRGLSMGESLEVLRTDRRGTSTIRIIEVGTKACENYLELPMALGPDTPIPTTSIRSAMAELATQAVDDLAEASRGNGAARLAGPTADLLLRRPPRLTGGRSLPEVVDDGFVAAITEAVMALDDSALAVQGPPGTGKTYVGARVVARLIERGWKIGVVSQGHAVINNLLNEVIDVGVASERVAKKSRPDASRWTELNPAEFPEFLNQDGGCVLGGTAWDFTNIKRVKRNGLDLLVVDEAGQYSLATTMAVSVCAQRLLLLGDPQQLPQVSAGYHAEPVDESALGWLSDGQTLDSELGYFLDKTYRMSPELTEPVSHHSYADRLESEVSITGARSMTDPSGNPIPAGLFSQTVGHQGSSVASEPEAARIVELVREALTWTWKGSEAEAARPMSQSDVLIVAPYNAQIDLIKAKLADAALPGVPVGTVDKFQGQQAPVVFASMTASAPEDVPRGMDFLLLPNRINVAISRAKWRATIVYAPALTSYAPTTPEGLADLGGFLELVNPH